MSQLLGIDASRPVSPLEMLGIVDGHCDYWTTIEANITHGEPLDWSFLVKDYNGSIDQPSAAYFKQLVDAYPEAKVILTVRDAAAVQRSSAASWCRLIGVGSLTDWLVSLVYSLRPYGRRFFRMHDAMGRATGRALGRADFSWRRVCEDEAYGAAFFDEWNTYVRRVVPSHRLLVFETGKHGYHELARHLGVKPPKNKDEPYPRTNSTAEFAFVLIIMRVFAVLTLAVPVLVAWRCCAGGTAKSARKPKGS